METQGLSDQKALDWNTNWIQRNQTDMNRMQSPQCGLIGLSVKPLLGMWIMGEADAPVR